MRAGRRLANLKARLDQRSRWRVGAIGRDWLQRLLFMHPLLQLQRLHAQLKPAGKITYQDVAAFAAR